MKRDIELIRALLLHYEGDRKPDLRKWSTAHKTYHAKMLLTSGMVSGKIYDSGYEDDAVLIERLTVEGRDFLQAVRDDTAWMGAKQKLSAAGHTVPLPMLTALLVDSAKKADASAQSAG